MVAFVSGNGLGLSNSSLALVGSGGVVGDAHAGRDRQEIYVNAATGNLVIQRQDEYVSSQGYGPGISLVRTYNSQGLLNDDNGDNWRMSVVKTLGSYVANSFITRTDGDGVALVYRYDSTTNSYVNKDGSGSFDRLTLAGNVWTWTDGATQTRESYDWTGTAGKITSTTDTLGNSVTYGYTGDLLTLVTDAAGEKTELVYSGNNLTDLKTTRADGSDLTRVHYEYDTSNRLTKVVVDLTPDDGTDAQTYSTTYGYTGTTKRVASITQDDGTSIAIGYAYSSGVFRVNSISQVVGGVTRSTGVIYNTTARTATVTDPLGGSSAITYDANNRLTALKLPPTAAGATQTFAYAYSSISGKLSTQTDPRGIVTEYTYDALGNQTGQRCGNTAPGVLSPNGTGDVITRTFSETTGVLLSETVFFAPDPDGTAGAASATDGHTTRYVYNGAESRVRFVVSDQGRVTEYQYDGFGRRTLEIEYADRVYGGLFTESALSTWAAGADKTQTMLTVTSYSILGSGVAYAGDLVKDVTRYTSVDSNGNGLAAGKSTTHYIYDQAGQLLAITAPNRFGTADDSAIGVTHYVYDGLGRVTATTDALGNQTVTLYDDVGKKIVTEVRVAGAVPSILTTTRLYDAAGELISLAQSDSSGTALGTTQYWYDKLGRLRMVQDPTGVKTYSLYDPAGRKVADIDGNGALREYDYNLDNQLVTTTSYFTLVPAAKLASLVDAYGNPSTAALSTIRPVSDPKDRKGWMLYDMKGRLAKTVDEVGRVTAFQYDGGDRVTATIVYATNVAVGSITTATKADSPLFVASASDQRTRNFWDGDGLLLGTLDATGTLVTYAYDAAGRLRHTLQYANVAPNNTGNPNSSWATGLLANLMPASDPESDLHHWFFYDAQGRVTGEVDGGSFLTETTYDRDGNVAQSIRYSAATTLPASQITLASTLAQVRPLALAGSESQSTYSDLGQLASSTQPDGVVTLYTYDALGNLVRTDRQLGSTDQRTAQTRRDALGRITSELSGLGSVALAGLPAGATTAQVTAVWAQYGVSYAYDMAGRRVSMTDSNGQTTLYYYDNAGQMVYTIDAAGEVVHRKYNGLGQIAQTVEYGTRLSAATLATLSGGLVTAAATTAVNGLVNVALDRTVTYQYGLDGQLSSQQDNLARSSSVAYNSLGLVRSRTDELGNITRYVYDADNRLVYELDAMNSLIAYTYDNLGRLVRTVAYAKPVPAASIAPNATTALTTASFTSTLLASISDTGHDNVSTNLYDQSGRIRYTLSGKGSVRGWTYDSTGNVLTETAYVNTVQLGSASTIGALESVLAPDALRDLVNYNSYDAMGRLAYKADATGAVVTFQYDANGNLVERLAYATRIANPAGRAIPARDAALDEHTRMVYDADNRLVRSATAQGNLRWAVTANTYDNAGNLTAVTRYATTLAESTLAANATQAQVGTWMGQVSANSALDSTSRRVYDAMGRVVYDIDPLGVVTLNVYDAAGRIVQTRTYATVPSLGGTLTATGVAAAVAALAPNGADRIQRTVYDTAGRPVFQIDGVGGVTQNTFDAAGNVTTVKQYAQAVNVATLPAAPTVASMQALVNAALDSANDRTEKRAYDADNRLVYSMDPAGFVTERRYDALGHVTERIQHTTAIAPATLATVAAIKSLLDAQTVAARNGDIKLSWDFDADGNLQKSTDALGNFETTLYNGAGERTSFTNKLQFVWTYEYDAAGRLYRELSPAIVATSVVFNVAGTPSLIQTGNVPLETQIAYDAFGRVSSRTEAVGTSQQRTTSYVYDAAGRQVKTIFPQVVIFDKDSTLAANSYTFTTVTVSPEATVTYDALGRAVMNLDVGGNYSYKLYDAAGLVKYEIDAAGYLTEYQRNSFGEVKTLIRYAQKMSMAPGIAPTLAAVQTFTTTGTHSADRAIITQYDNAGRAVKVVEPQVYSYDTAHGDSNSPFTAGKATATVYNAFGEVLKQSIYGENAAGAVQTVAADTFYRYNVLGQQVAQINIADRARNASFGTGYLTTMTYDAVGNLASRKEYATAQSYADSSWNARSGMAYTPPAASSAGEDRETTYAYDAASNKLSETRIGVSYSTVSNGTTAAGNLTTTYTYDSLGNQVSTTDASGTATYTYRDVLGRITAVATMPAQYKQRQITAIFLALLGRAPTAGELAANAPLDATSIARNIYAGNAAVQGLSDTAFVMQLYQNLAGRPADAGGLEDWLEKLANANAAEGGGNSGRARLTVDFISAVTASLNQDTAVMNSRISALRTGTSLSVATEATLARIKAAQIYVAILGRSPDPGGMGFYTTGSLTPNQIAQAMFDSPEGLSLFPPGMSALETATRLYQSIYGHAPDEAALNQWLPLVPAARSGLGGYVNSMISQLLAGGSGSSLTAFTNKALAGVSEGIDTSATPGTLTRLILDAYGNASVRTDYAAGAQAVGGEFIAAPSADDRNTYTWYDAGGRARATRNANGHMSYTAYDAFGHSVADLRMVKDSDTGTVSSGHQVYQVRKYDALGQLIEVGDPGSAHKIIFNAFGEVASRSVNGDSAYEYNDYDNAGHVWRTNAGDGVDKVFLFDIFGDRTAQFRSALTSLKSFTSAADVVIAGHTVRTDYVFDLQGNVLTQTNPLQYASDVGTVNGSTITATSVASLQGMSFSAAITGIPTWQVIGFTGGSEGEDIYGWVGTNSVRVGWSSLAGLGAGDIRVELTYHLTDGSTGITINDFTADRALDGAAVAWDVADGKPPVDSIVGVKLFKKNIQGEWSIVSNRTNLSDVGTLLRVDAPADPTTIVTVEYRLSGTSAWLPMSAARFGDALLCDLSSKPEGLYEYRVLNKKSTDTAAQAVDSGTLSLVNLPLRTQVAQLYAAIFHRAPDLGGLGLYIQSGTMTPAQIAQAFYASGEDGLAAAKANGTLLQNIVTLGFGIASPNPSGELAVNMTGWLSALNAASSTTAGSVIAGIVSTVANYTGTDADMLAARDLLAKKATAGLAYAVDYGGYDADEAQAIMSSLNAGSSVADAIAQGRGALYRRQITQLYLAIFNRAPDYDGLVYQVNRLAQGVTLANVAQNMYGSAEAKAGGLYWNANGTAMSDAQFATQVYKIAGRTASATDIQWWADRLRGDTTLRGQVFLEMINSIANYAGGDSTMFTARQVFNNKVAIALTYAWDVQRPMTADQRLTFKTAIEDALYDLVSGSTNASTALASAQAAVAKIQADAAAAAGGVLATNVAANAAPIEQMRRQIAQLYVALLNRAPDLAGMNYYVGKMQAPTVPIWGLKDVANGMISSPEGQLSTFFLNTTDEQFVTKIYLNGFNRSPVAAEMANWINSLQVQNLDRGTVAQQIIESIVNMTDGNSLSTRTLFANKVGVGLMYSVNMGGGDMATCRALMMQVTNAAGYATTTAIETATTAITNAAWSAAVNTATATLSAYTKANWSSNAASAAAALQAATNTAKNTPTTTASQQFTWIAQLYLGALLRPGTYTEMDYHFQQFQSGRTLSAIAQDFLNSTEGQGKYAVGLSSSVFIDTVYRNVLLRGADSGALSYYGQQLANGQTKGQVLMNIITGFLENAGATADLANRAAFGQKLANELSAAKTAATSAGYAAAGSLATASTKAAADLAAENAAVNAVNAAAIDASTTVSAAGQQYIQITQMLLAGLNRAGSLADENYYYGELQTGVSIDQLAEYVVYSVEGSAIYGGLSNAAFVNKVYTIVFGRSVDPSGSTKWTNALNTGQTRGQVLMGITNSLLTSIELQAKANFMQRVKTTLSSVNTSAQAARNDATTAYKNAVSLATNAALQAASVGDQTAATALNANTPTGISARNRLLIVRLYTLLLNHGPDAATLNSLATQMTAGTTPAQVAAIILASTEGVARYTNRTGTTFIDAVFQASLGRPATAFDKSQFSGTNAQIAVSIVSTIANYGGTDASDIEAQNLLNIKVLLTMSNLAGAMQVEADLLAREAAQAALVLTATPQPSDVLRASGWLASGTSGLQQAGARPVVNRTFDRWGNVRTQSDPRHAGWVTAYTYNANNQATEIKDGTGALTQHYYDALGRDVASRDANGNVNGRVYDGMGNLVEELHADGATVQNLYDAFGQRIQQRQADGQMTAYRYDGVGNLTSTIRAYNVGVDVYRTSAADVISWNPVGAQFQYHGSLTETYTYNELGWRIRTKNASGATTTTKYDDRGNVVETRDAAGRITTYGWNAYNRKTSEVALTSFGTPLSGQGWALNIFGQLTQYKDESGVATDYAYDQLGQLTSQTSGYGQDLRYTYDEASGLLVKIEDRAKLTAGGSAGTQQVTQYAYDLAGNRTREKSSFVNVATGAETDVAQDNHIAYDANGRVTDIQDARYSVHYQYDANGNRTRQTTHYRTETTSESTGDTATDLDTWSQFDVMNRQTIVDGIKVNGIGPVVISHDANDKPLGQQISYDSAGKRLMVRQWGTRLAQNEEGQWMTPKGEVREAYAYDAGGRLTDTWREGQNIDQRRYDASGRVLSTGQVGLQDIPIVGLNAAGISPQTRYNAYDDSGQLVAQALMSQDLTTRPESSIYYEYDARGRLALYNMSMHNAGYARNYSYAYGAAGRLASITVNDVADGGALLDVIGKTENTYDANGFLVHVDGGSTNRSDTRDLINDAQGRLLRKTQVDPNDATQVHVTTSLVVNGQLIGSSSDAQAPSVGTFNQSYVPTTDPGLSGPSAHTVQRGESLQTIAQALWGDANLWYLIADANGVSSVIEGDVIVIPAKPNTLYDNSQTFKPYNLADSVGDITPTLAIPQDGGGGCGGLGQIIMAVVVIAVAVITQQYYLADILVPTTTDLVIAGAIGGAAGSVAGQVAGNALGIVDGFNLKAIALGAIGGAIAGGLSGVNVTGGLLKGAGNMAARAAIGNALTQGIGVATGLQDKFDWKSVATAAIGAGIAVNVEAGLSGTGFESAFGKLGVRATAGVAGGVASAFVRGGRIDGMAVARDAFGYVIGSSLAEVSSGGQPNSAAAANAFVDAVNGFSQAGAERYAGANFADAGNSYDDTFRRDNLSRMSNLATDAMPGGSGWVDAEGRFHVVVTGTSADVPAIDSTQANFRLREIEQMNVTGGSSFQDVNNQRVADGGYNRFSEIGQAWSAGRFGDAWSHFAFDASDAAKRSVSQRLAPPALQPNALRLNNMLVSPIGTMFSVIGRGFGVSQHAQDALLATGTVAEQLGGARTGVYKQTLTALAPMPGTQASRSRGVTVPSFDVPYRPLSPTQRQEFSAKLENRTMSRDEYERYNWDARFKSRRAEGIREFWAQERSRLQNGIPGTRDWDDQQLGTILNGRRPQFQGQTMQGHHEYSALKYPQLANNPRLIYPSTPREHLYRWHGGNTRNPTNGMPLNPRFPEEF